MVQTEHAVARRSEQFRDFTDYSSLRGFDTQSVPWRLWEKAKVHGIWNPADIDFSQDQTAWAELNEDQKGAIAGLAQGFMVGEEAVTLDILPLLKAIADEGRSAEAMYLTTFAFEEAKHTDFFRRFFDAIGLDLWSMMQQEIERTDGQVESDGIGDLFNETLPRAMRRLDADRSPEAFLDVGLVYNQYIEGCLAMAGYRVWNSYFTEWVPLPGLQAGIALIQKDERRHLAYGTYLCRRVLARNPELWPFAERRMQELVDATVAGSGGYGAAAGDPFLAGVIELAPRRLQVLSAALAMRPEDVERGSGGDVEDELEGDAA